MVELGGIFAGLARIGLDAFGGTRAYRIARLSERHDAIASMTSWEELDLAAWTVWATGLFL
ncbi:MAG: hypothetical protein V5A18_07040, partial [Haloarculaceae archaeon]